MCVYAGESHRTTLFCFAMSLGAPKIKVGDTIPMDVVVHQGFAGNTPDAPKPMSAFLKGKNVLLVSLPGAFTPT